jgi:hypothetical protein
MLKMAKIRLRIMIATLIIGKRSQNFPLFIKKRIERKIIVKENNIIKKIEPKPSLLFLLYSYIIY